MPQMLAALDFSLNGPRQIIIAGKQEAPETRALLNEIHARFIPNKIIMLAEGAPGQQPAGYPDLFSGLGEGSGRATAYLCENYHCRLPASSPAELAAALDNREA